MNVKWYNQCDSVALLWVDSVALLGGRQHLHIYILAVTVTLLIAMLRAATYKDNIAICLVCHESRLVQGIDVFHTKACATLL